MSIFSLFVTFNETCIYISTLEETQIITILITVLWQNGNTCCNTLRNFNRSSIEKSRNDARKSFATVRLELMSNLNPS